jgi:tRNA(fMet)-specific endonuclease VapC
MILCDTNILIEFYKGNTATTQTLKAIGQNNIAVSVITKAEYCMAQGIGRSLRG